MYDFTRYLFPFKPAVHRSSPFPHLTPAPLNLKHPHLAPPWQSQQQLLLLLLLLLRQRQLAYLEDERSLGR